MRLKQTWRSTDPALNRPLKSFDEEFQVHTNLERTMKSFDLKCRVCTMTADNGVTLHPKEKAIELRTLLVRINHKGEQNIST